jgi:hypothetical protein
LVGWSDGRSRRKPIRSVASLEHYNDAGGFRLVRFETRERFIAPTGKTYDLASLGFRFVRFRGLQHVEATAVQKERVISENATQLRLRRMIIWKHLSLKLAECLLCLG